MKKKVVVSVLLAMLLIGASLCATLYFFLLAPQFFPQQTVYIYIDRDDTIDSIYNKVKEQGCLRHLEGFRWMTRYRSYDKHIYTGRYVIRQGESVRDVFGRLSRGYQEPMNLTLHSVRTLDKLARSVGRQLMIDSAEIACALQDTALLRRLGYTRETLPSLFIPDTYQVYWNISVEQFFNRMLTEHRSFWNEERTAKAAALGMTPAEVATLASIVEEETNNRDEKPIVAGLYINRLRRNIPLQADPTVKFAMQDFALRRINNAHLKVESPYNTYLHAGLPPGPIRIPTPVGLDAVLNYTRHGYLYMCAKEDFSGTHNFATTLSEHYSNARRYWKALNQRKIYK